MTEQWMYDVQLKCMAVQAIAPTRILAETQGIDSVLKKWECAYRDLMQLFDSYMKVKRESEKRI